jgi:hypothetical protein
LFFSTTAYYLMMIAIRLLLLLALSLQTVASSWATSSDILRVSANPKYTFITAYTGLMAASESGSTEYTGNKTDSMDFPCDLVDNETWDTASDEGLKETLNFRIAAKGSKTLLPHSEQRYNFFIRYGIPPPEFL